MKPPSTVVGCAYSITGRQWLYLCRDCAVEGADASERLPKGTLIRPVHSWHDGNRRCATCGDVFLGPVTLVGGPALAVEAN